MSEKDGICYSCKNVTWDIDLKKPIESDTKKCSIDYLFLEKKYSCIGYDPVVV